MSKHWNDELMALEAKHNLTSGQVVRERWDLQWEIDHLQKMLEKKDAEIGALRFDVAMLKAELNATRGKRNGNA